MIIDFDKTAFNFMTDFNGPDRQFPNPFYKSGVYEEENPVYKNGPDSVEYPTLTLPCNLYDTYGNMIPDGFYTAVLSPDRKYINLYQGKDIKARVKVIKLVEKMYTNEELREEDEIIKKLVAAKAKKKLKKIKEAEEELAAFKDKVAASSYAEIYDSGRGYYILKYNMRGSKAEGIIQK